MFKKLKITVFGFTGLWMFFMMVDAQSEIVIDQLQWRDDLVSHEGDPEFGEVWHQFQWIEKKIKGGTAQVFLKNTSPSPISLISVKLNGTSIEEYRERCDVSYWNLKPAAISQGEMGSLLIRFKEKPTEKITVNAVFSDNQTIQFVVDPATQSPGFRFESFGFAQDRSKIVVYLRRFDECAGDRIVHLWMNGKKVGGFFSGVKANWISEKFTQNLSAVEVSPDVMPRLGSYLYFKAESSSGKVASYVIRVSDGFVQYGLFDEPHTANIPQLALNNMNTLSAHRQWSLEELDSMQHLGLRAVSYLKNIGGKGNPVGPLDHPAYDSIYSIDEPDVWDFAYIDKYKKEIPYHKRPGYLGMTVAQELHEIQGFDNGRVQASLVVDNTVRPWNWFEYGELPDMICSDNYTLPNSTSIFLVVKQQQLVMDAVAPIPVVHAFETTWHEFDTTIYRRFNRPKTAGEYRRLLLYPLGAGAKGLTGWWNVTDFNSVYNTWATSEFPDQWAIQAKTFAEIGQIAPLIAIGHPFDGAQANNPKAWVSLVLAGKDAALLFVGNEDIRYTTYFSLQHPLMNLEVKIPAMAWNSPVRAVKLNGFDQTEIPIIKNSDGSTSLMVGTVHDCETILLSSNPLLPEKIHADYLASRNESGGFSTQIIREYYKKNQETGLMSAIRRDLKLNRQDNLIRSYPLQGGKEDHHPNFANPRNDAMNASGWFTQSNKPEEIGFRIPLTVGQPGDVLLAFQLQSAKSLMEFQLFLNNQKVEGVEIKRESFSHQQWVFLNVKIPAAGSFELRGIQRPALDLKRVIPGCQYWPSHVPMPPIEEGKEYEVRTGYVSKWVYFIPGITFEGLIHNQFPSESMAVSPTLFPLHGVLPQQSEVTNRALENYIQGNCPTRITQSTQTGKKFELKEDKIVADRVTFIPAPKRTICSQKIFWFLNQNKGMNAVEVSPQMSEASSLVGYYPWETSNNLESLFLIEGEISSGALIPRIENENGKILSSMEAKIQLHRIDDHAYLLGVQAQSPGTYKIAFYTSAERTESPSWISLEAAKLKESDYWEALYKTKQAVRIPKAENKLYPMRTLKGFWE